MHPIGMDTEDSGISALISLNDLKGGGLCVCVCVWGGLSNSEVLLGSIRAAHVGASQLGLSGAGG